jgi:hypothetical protein
MLVSSGEMSQKVGGPSVTEDKPRRSLYLKSFRNQNDTFLHGFDVANGLQSVALRDNTTTPTQSLLLLNGKYALGQASKFADRLAAMQLPPDETLRMAFRWTWGREPSQREWEKATQYVNYVAGEDAPAIEVDKLSDFCHILFNSNQFLYLE